MKKLFLLLACVAMSVLAMGQDNQLVWANGRLLYGSPITNVDSLTYDEVAGMDTLLLPRVLIKEVVKEVHDTVYVTQVVHDTVYVETDCGGEGDTPSAGIGVFSVSADKQVTFSKGNLQYHPANDEWRFAESQLDYIGYANSNIAADYDGWIDLFGWGTGDAPTKASTSYSDYSTFVDWGTNQIGSDAPNTWRTLTSDEWMYIFYNRPNAQSLFALGSVNGVNGTIILPDNWTTPSGVSFVASTTQGLSWHGSYYYNSNGNNSSHNTYTTEQWQTMEQAGAVFLPANGGRWGTDVDLVGYDGNYWSSTVKREDYAYLVGFDSSRLIPQGYSTRDGGRSVRLVKDIEGGGATPDTPDTPAEPEEPENTENGHEYVDLGLSVKWATCNVGASQPEEYGDYFAWGEVEPKEEYTLSNYKWSDGTYSGMSKYEMHSLTTLEKEDDVANIHWGSTWHTPTHLNWEELRTDCNWTLLTHNGIDGYKVTGPNGNSIFIPMGDYWSSSLYIEGSSSYLSYGHNSDLNFYGRWIYYRETGNSIRPVCE